MRRLFHGTNRVTAEKIEAEVASICKSAGVPVPRWYYHKYNMWANTRPPHGIHMPDIDWIHDNDNGEEETRNWRIWITALHETAHWIDAYMHSESQPVADHCPRTYEILLSLWMERQLPLDILWISESKYKPGALTRAMKRAARSIIQGVHPDALPFTPSSTV